MSVSEAPAISLKPTANNTTLHYVQNKAIYSEVNRTSQLFSTMPTVAYGTNPLWCALPLRVYFL